MHVVLIHDFPLLEVQDCSGKNRQCFVVTYMVNDMNVAITYSYKLLKRSLCFVSAGLVGLGSLPSP